MKVSDIDRGMLRALAGELVEIAQGILGTQKEVVCDQERLRPTNSEVQHLLSNPSLANQLLGWRPDVTLEEGIGKMVEWLRTHLDMYSPDRYNI